MGPAAADFIGVHTSGGHCPQNGTSPADRPWPGEKCAEVPFPAGVLQFHPPHTKLGAGILGERLWESPTTEKA